MDNKNHPEIPVGPYCYTILSVNETTGVIKTKSCPHWKVVEIDNNKVVRARCNLLNIEDKDYMDLTLLWDQCKLCNINDPDELE